MGKLSDVVEALSGLLHLLGVQRLSQSLLGQMSVQLQPHPGLAVLAQEVPFIRPEVNWRRQKNKRLHQSREENASELISTLYHTFRFQEGSWI